MTKELVNKCLERPQEFVDELLGAAWHHQASLQMPIKEYNKAVYIADCYRFTRQWVFNHA